ncbi:MAG TPA: SAM-dependent methyltransferase [Lachnospiraceae bacterium]|nr:SAM-dependent methyltransferase [Lachnospiraceae bacterium]
MEGQSSTKTEELLEGERLDDLQINGLFVIQNRKKFCFGIDAVLLGNYAVVRAGENVLDIGTGTGVIPLLLSAKTEGRHFTGLEVLEESAKMAERSVRLNGLSDRIDIICGDICRAGEFIEAGSYNVITCNPPYMIYDHGLLNESREKAVARHEILCTFDDIAKQSARILKEGGRLYIIHRPFRLADIFESLRRYHLEPKRMRLVQSYADKEPSMVLMEAVKGGRARLNVERPLVIYESMNVYTREIYEIYGKYGNDPLGGTDGPERTEERS